jgi:hypothetical protein
MRSFPVALVFGLLAPLSAAAQVRIAKPAAVATPTPAPVVAAFRPPVPLHSPDSLDFGAVFDGESSRRTFTLTANGKGYVTAAVPDGPWRVAEYRQMAPGSTTAGNMAVRNVKARIVDPPKPWQWSLGEGDEIQIDLLFAPKFDLAKMTAGPKSATMRITGPGPMGTWTLNVPLGGTFNGIKLKPVFLAEEKEVYAVEGDATHDVPVSVSSIGGALNATIRPGSLPAGVTMLPVGAPVPSNGTTKTKVRLSFAWGSGGLKGDAQTRNVELLLDYPGGPQKLTVSVVPVPGSFERTWQKRTDCGVAEFNLQYYVKTNADGLVWAWGSNVDLINRRYVWWEVRVPGEVLSNGNISFLERKYDATRQQSRPFAVAPERMAKIVRGPVTLACGQMEVRNGVLVKP